MKKVLKQCLAIALCLLTLLTIAPTTEFAGLVLNAFAEGTNKTDVKVYSDPKIAEHTTQYRYRVKANQVSPATSLPGWDRISEAEPLYGDWSAEKNSTTQQTESDTLHITKTESATRYRYYHYTGKKSGTTYWHFCPKQGANYNSGVSFSKAYSSWYSESNRLSGTTHSQQHESGVGGATSTTACSYCGMKAGQKPQKYMVGSTPYYAEEKNTYTAKWYYKTRTKTSRYNYTQYSDYSSWSYTEATSIDELSFDRQDGVEYTLETESRPVAVDEYGVVYSEDMTRIYSVPTQLRTECFNIPSSVTEICEAAFYQCEEIKEVVIPASVIKIAANAFNNCLSLESVVIPENVTEIGDGAFANCSALGSVFFKSEVPITLGSNCFAYTAIECFYVYFLAFKDAWLEYESSWNGYPLEGFNPPGELYSSIDENGTDRQGFTYSLNENSRTAAIISYSGGAEVIFPKRVIKDNMDYVVSSFTADAFKGKTRITRISMSKLITSIPANAFDGCTGLTEISYNGNFKSVGEYAFRNCTRLKGFNSMNGLSIIAAGAFYNCSQLMDISIPIGMKSIGDSAFYGCAKLGNIVIPSSVTSIGANAFNGCKSISLVTFEGAPSIGANAFANCTALIKAKYKRDPSSSVGSGAFSGNSTFGVEYPTNNQTWKAQVNNFLWRGYKALSTEIVTRVGINAYVIHITTPKGKSLPNATVKLAGQSSVTDEYGNAYFAKPSSITVSLKVEPREAEYQDFSNSSYAVKRAPYDVISLSYETGSVSGVKFNNTDIKSGKAVINNCYEKRSVLTVYVTAPQKVTKLEVFSGNSVVASKQNIPAGKGNVSFNINNRKLEQGKAIKVKMTLANGQVTYSDTLKIVPFKGLPVSLEFANSYDKDNKGEYGFDLSGCEYSALSKIKIKFPTKGIMSFLSVKLLNNEDSMSIGLNYEPSADLIPETTLVKKAKTLAQKESTYKVGISSGLCGVVNLGFNPNKNIYYIKNACVKAFVKITSNVGATVSIVNIPIRIELDLEGKVTLTFNLESKDMNQGLKAGMLALRPSAKDLDIDFGVKVSAGFGCKAASVGIFGSYELNWQVMNAKLFGTGTFGGYIKVLCVRRERIFVSTKKKQLLPRTNKAKTQAWENGYLSELYSIDQLVPIERDYLESRSKWLSGTGSRMLARAKAGAPESVTELATLQTGVYDYVEPKIITCNGITMMVYTDDIASRGGNDLQALVYSVYDPATGTWSDPQQIDQNDTFDNNFSLFCDDSHIYIAYSEANKTFGDSGELADISAAEDISLASFNTTTGRFDKVESVNHDDVYDMIPTFAMIDNIPTVVWVRNMQNNVFGMDHSNEIVYSQYHNGTWTAPQSLLSKMPWVTSIAIGKLNGSTYVAATCDADNDPETQDDNKLLLVGFDGSVREVETGSNNNANVQFVSYKGKDALIWNNNGQVDALTDASAEPVAVIESRDFSIDPNFNWIDCGNGKYAVTFVSADKENSNVCCVYYDGDQWTHPIQITNSVDCIGAYDAAYVDHQFIIPYRDTAVTFSDTEDEFYTSADLRVAYISPVADAYVIDATPDRQSLACGENVEMTLSVFNNGFNDMEHVLITMKNATGTTVFTSTEAASIGVGETKEIDVTFTAPAAVEDGLYQITVEDADRTNKEDPKVFELDLWQSDLSVEAEQLILGEENALMVNVTNRGFVTSAVSQLNIANGIYDSSADPFATLEVEALTPGETASFFVELNDGIYTDEDTSGIVTAWVTTEGTDAIQSNDNATVAIAHFEKDDGYDQDEVVRYTPDLSTDTVYVDLAAVEDVPLVVECNGNVFSGIKEMEQGNQYVYSENLLTLKASYLSGLGPGIYELELVFNEGCEDEYTAVLCISVTDSTLKPLCGAVTIEGEAVYGHLLELNDADLEPFGAEYQVSWKRDGIVVGRDPVYKVCAEDIGKNLSVSIEGINRYCGTLSANAVVPVKADGITLLTPNSAENDQTSISLTFYEGYEYKCNNGAWTKNPVFEGLTPNTEYGFCVRKAETATHSAGGPSVMTKIKTQPVPWDAEIAIEGIPVRGETLTANIINPGTATYSLQWYRNGEAIQGATGNTYTTAVADVKCDITVKATASGTSVGEITAAPVVITCKHAYDWTMTRQPTCEGNGIETGTCVCGDTITQEISPLGHTEADENGNCSRCGKPIGAPANPNDPQQNKDICKWCGQIHNGILGKIIGFLHKILVLFLGAKY